MVNKIPVIPPSMRKVYLRLKRRRSSHTGRLPIPERLWAAAAELAREHGIFPTAKTLHLEYGKLQQRAEGPGPAVSRRGAKVLTAVPRSTGRTAPPTFVELVAPQSGGFPAGVVELEGPRGRMRIKATRRPIACLAWSSAPRHLGARDRLIG
jgi:hypothetical protein